jgi:hypothetical protein
VASLAWRDTSPIVFRLVQGVSGGKGNRGLGEYGGKGLVVGREEHSVAVEAICPLAGLVVRDLQGLAGLEKGWARKGSIADNPPKSPLPTGVCLVSIESLI